jgi:hypothetical protein
MKAIITQATEVDANGQQSVSFDIVDDEQIVLVNNISASADVEELEERVRAIVTGFQTKYLSDKKLKIGDEVEA